ncbi:MAG: ribosome biogenesis GTPase YlqF [SAR324 cluster bacterium]|nr:ribosome biogenesis GTPase YlqF [SAR324 cluster bacterium]
MQTSSPEQSHDIQWYPGHMVKAKKEFMAKIRLVDVVLEVRDARIPRCSVNPEFAQALHQKNRIVLFNKTGLADPEVTEQWKQIFDSEQVFHLFIDVKDNLNVKKIIPLARQLVKAKWDRYRSKGIRPPMMRLMVIGIPNVGKSSLINKLVRKKAAGTGPMPGVTRQQQWVKIDENIELLDTPGILWPKFDTEEEGFRLAVTGSIKDDVVGIEKITRYLLNYYLEHLPERLETSYELPEKLKGTSFEQSLLMIAQKRGCLTAGGGVDTQRICQLLLRDFREGRLGRVTFDLPS